MKLDKVLFGIVLAMWGVVLAAMLLPDLQSGGVVHPEFPSMRHGSSGSEQHAATLWLGWVFGTLTILYVGTSIAFGGRQRERLRGLGRPVLYALAVYLGVWTSLVITYRLYLGEEAHSLFLAFPAPTALMLYVLFPVSVVFNLYFVFGLKRWVLSDEDFAAYQRLLEQSRKNAAAEGTAPMSEEES